MCTIGNLPRQAEACQSVISRWDIWDGCDANRRNRSHSTVGLQLERSTKSVAQARLWRIIVTMRLLTTLRERTEQLTRVLRPPRQPTVASGMDVLRHEPPPRFHELGHADPVRPIVERVMLGDELRNEDVYTLIAATAECGCSRWKAAVAASWALGRAKFDTERTADVIRALANVLQTRKWALTGCTAPLTIGCSFSAVVAVPIFAYLLIKDARLNAVRSQAATALGLLKCVPAIGDLARALGDRNRPGCSAVRQAALKALTELLPQVTPEHEGQMPAGAEQHLVNVLSQYEATDPLVTTGGLKPACETDETETALCAAMLRALGHIGGAASIPIANRLQAPRFPEMIRAAAREVAPILTQRAQRRMDAARLLRPATAPGSPEDTLLRPVETAPSGDAGMLVRPVEDDPAER